MILDRIEGDSAILELDNGALIQVPAGLLPAGVKEGDCLRLVVDTDATEERRQRMKEKMNRLFRD